MNRSSSNFTILGLASAGVILAGWLTVEHYLPEAALPCGAGPGGCESVLRSSFSHLGPIPTAAFGFLMYAAFVVLCVYRQRLLNRQRTSSIRITDPGGAEQAPGNGNSTDSLVHTDALGELLRVDRWIWLLALAGILISWGLQYVVLFVIGSFCPYCFTSAILVALIFVVSSWEYLLRAQPLTESQKLIAGWCVLAIGIAGFTIYTRSQQQRAIRIATMGAVSDTQAPATKVTDIPRGELIHSDSHILGSRSAPYLLVEFGDYQCPSCKLGSAKAAQLTQGSNGRVSLVFRNLPLPRHQWAMAAAHAAEAAANQGKFWQMHDLIYKDQYMLESMQFTPVQFTRWARSLGLNIAQFEKDMASSSIDARIKADMDDASATATTSTPTFYFLSAHSIWRFSRTEALDAAFKDPHHPIWEQ